MSTTTLSLAPTLQLANGVQMPQIGLGTWPMDDKEAARAVAQAIGIGYRLIDTAENYGNEQGVGEGLRHGGVPREELFLTTKFNRKWHSREGVRTACEAALQRLHLDYIDLLLIHWPNPDQDRFVEAFEGMVKLREEGKLRAIGVSNFKPHHLEKLFAAGLCPQVNQIELDPTRPRADTVATNAAHHIITEAWSPLGRNGGLLEDPVITRIAQAHGRKPGQIVLRWHVQHGYAATPKSSNPARQAENLDLFSFTLSPDDIAALDALANPGAKIQDSDTFGH